MDRGERFAVARKRLARVLRNNDVCLARTLEQKISDAGPNPMRIDPHILTQVRSNMIKEGIIRSQKHNHAPWYSLTSTPEDKVEDRLKLLGPIHEKMQKPNFSQRLGQTMEIAVFKALKDEKKFKIFGDYPNLNDHNDDKVYKKIEPPSSVSGQSMKGEADFLIITKKGEIAALEVKNIREWLYPDREEVKSIITKSLAIDAVPVLIARRIHFVTFKVLSACGVVMHQTYNQLFPSSNQELAEKASNKNLLGYHDIRVGNDPDNRLKKFISENLPNLLDEARERFEENKDLLEEFSSENMPYKEFAARVRRRVNETNEDNDWEL